MGTAEVANASYETEFPISSLNVKAPDAVILISNYLLVGLRFPLICSTK